MGRVKTINQRIMSKYEIQDNEIHVYYSNGDIDVYPFSIDGISKILHNANIQAVDLMKLSSDLINIKFANCLYGLLSIIFAVPFLSLAVRFKSLLFFGIGLGVFVPSAIFNLVRILKANKELKNIQKQFLFLDNQELINKKMQDSDVKKEDLTMKLGKRAKNVIKTEPEISLSDMEEFSYGDVKRLINNTSGNKHKTLVRRKRNDM